MRQAKESPLTVLEDEEDEVEVFEVEGQITDSEDQESVRQAATEAVSKRSWSEVVRQKARHNTDQDEASVSARGHAAKRSKVTRSTSMFEVANADPRFVKRRWFRCKEGG